MKVLRGVTLIILGVAGGGSGISRPKHTRKALTLRYSKGFFLLNPRHTAKYSSFKINQRYHPTLHSIRNLRRHSKSIDDDITGYDNDNQEGQQNQDEEQKWEYKPDDLTEFVTATAKDTDPFGFDFGQDLNQDKDPDSRFKETGNPEDSVAYGPEAVLLAGFKVDEIAMVRILLDKAGGQAVKVVPLTEPMLDGSLEAGLEVEEPDIRFIKQNTPDVLVTSWNHRVIVFAGITWAAQATIIELLDHNWKGQVPFIVYVAATMVNKDTNLRQLLTEELEKQVAAGRDELQPLEEVHEESGRLRSWRPNASEIVAREPDPVKERLKEQERYDAIDNEALRELEDY
ncbi:hypothetical protein AAMO2058_000169200 [Amorphochlora amoebiformis]